MLEYADGGWHEYYNVEAGDYIPYFRYSYTSNLRYTVTFTDNSTLQAQGLNFEYGGAEYRIQSNDNQGDGEIWAAGSTYTGTISVAGVSCDVAVTVQDLPVKSIQLDPISLIENIGGDTEQWWNPQTEQLEEYYCYYSVKDDIFGTVTFTDNSTAPIENGSFRYEGRWVDLNCTHHQGSSEI